MTLRVWQSRAEVPRAIGRPTTALPGRRSHFPGTRTADRPAHNGAASPIPTVGGRRRALPSPNTTQPDPSRVGFTSGSARSRWPRTDRASTPAACCAVPVVSRRCAHTVEHSMHAVNTCDVGSILTLMPGCQGYASGCRHGTDARSSKRRSPRHGAGVSCKAAGAAADCKYVWTIMRRGCPRVPPPVISPRPRCS